MLGNRDTGVRLMGPVIVSLLFGALSRKEHDYLSLEKDRQRFTQPLYFHWNSRGLTHAGSESSERRSSASRTVAYWEKRIIPLAWKGCNFINKGGVSSLFSWKYRTSSK